MGVMKLRLMAIRFEAHGIQSLELRHSDGQALPPFTPGAHLELALPNGLKRSYSLCNNAQETCRYVVAVHHSPASRGGSRWVHEQLRVGELLDVGEPRNHFPLDDSQPCSVLIAGGIGITPLLCMVQHLESVGQRWILHYCARNESVAAFLPMLRDLTRRSATGTLNLHLSDLAGGCVPDLQAIVSQAPQGAHFYCCGPTPMLRSFEAATASLDAGRVHLEYFNAAPAAATGDSFEVELAVSGRVLKVPPDQSLLDVMLEAGVEVPYSCREGVCASCEVRVLGGEPDHRDLVLSASEKASNRVMMVCCSRSKTARLVLDC